MGLTVMEKLLDYVRSRYIQLFFLLLPCFAHVAL